MESFSRSTIDKLATTQAFLILVLWFLAQSTFFALTTPFGLPPDERYHFRFIKLFSQSGFSPFLSSQEGFYDLGQVTRLPFFLYHYLLSFPYRIIENFEHAYLVLRFLNLALAVGSILILRKIGKYLNLQPIVIFLSVLVLTNIMMFVFISSAINYDNLVIFLALASVYLTLKLLDRFDTRDFLALIAAMFAGVLTKEAFMPVALAVFIALGVKYFKNPKVFISWITQVHRNKQNILLLFFVLLLAIPLIFHFSQNLLTHQSITPKCDSVLTHSQCLENGIYARSDAFSKQDDLPITLTRTEYLGKWVDTMSSRTFGVLAHKSISNSPQIVAIVQILFMIGILFVIRNIRASDIKFLFLFFVTSVYLYFLIKTNHSSYIRRGIPDLAVQGRYSFPVLPLLIISTIHFTFMSLKSKTLMLAVTAFISIVFIASSLPGYVLNIPDGWSSFQGHDAIMRIER